MKISEIRELSNRLLSEENLEAIVIYLLETVWERPGSNQINRTAGNPIGISDKAWPMFEGLKMEHVITLDLDSVPKLKAELKTDAKAISVFVSSLFLNEAFEPHNKEAAVVFLSDRDIAVGEVEFDPHEIREKEYKKHCGLKVEITDEIIERSTFSSHEVIVPLNIFDEDLEEESEFYQLSEGIQQYGIAGGLPFWLQSEEYHNNIILQFHGGLVDMNLGDGGTMYVYEDTAFWQC